MYRIGEIVTLNINKTEGAGDNSLSVLAGITGMIVNAGTACGPGNYSYVVDFGPEGQWNCYHNEIDNLSNLEEDMGEEDDWEEDGLEEDISEEEHDRIYGDPPNSASIEVTEAEPALSLDPEPPLVQSKPINKKISFEEDLARMVKEAEENKSPF